MWFQVCPNHIIIEVGDFKIFLQITYISIIAPHSFVQIKYKSNIQTTIFFEINYKSNKLGSAVEQLKIVFGGKWAWRILNVLMILVFS